MSQRISLIVLTTILLSSFFFPLIVSAEETSWPLKQKESQDFLDIIRKEPLTKANEYFFSQSIYARDFNAPRKTGAVVLVKQVILKEELNYWFKEFPKQLSIKFIKAVFKIIPLIYGQDISTILELIEKATVEKATNYALNWLTEKEMKIGTGQLDYSFPSYQGNWQTINIQYIIVYEPINSSQGKIVAEFYSQNSIEPPIGTGPNAIGGNKDDTRLTPWPWDRWLENEKERNNDGKLEPFIVRVKGPVKKNDWGNFVWDNKKETPTVEIDFDNPVPEIEESDIILSQGEKWIEFEFWKEKLETIIEKIQTSGVGIKEETLGLIEKVKSYFGNLIPSAQIGMEEKTVPIPKINLGKLIPSSSQIKEILEKINNSFTDEPEKDIIVPKNPEMSLESLAEKLNEISRQTNLLLADSQTFLSEKGLELSQLKNIEAEEKKTDDIEEEKKEEEKETEKNKGEIIWCPPSSNQSPLRNKIVFNEIAWMGSPNSSNDEWIELKNISNSSIDLGNWQILDKAGTENGSQGIKISFTDSSQVTNSGFFLLERTDDSSVPNISADLIYTGGLNNTDEVLYLFDENCQLQDKTEANPNWPAGSNSSKRTMELPGSDPGNLPRSNLGNWQTSQNIGGTPRAENSSGYQAPPENNEINNNGNTGGGGGSNTSSNKPPVSTAKLLISEIQIESENGSKDEFIEIYNPNNSAVSLRGWSIQKAASSGSISKKNFRDNDEIASNGYFLIANNYANQNLLKLANMTHNSFLIASGNTIFLVANQDSIVFGNEDTIKDKVGWGKTFSPEGMSAQEPAINQTIGRKWLESSAQYQDKDNNQEDFEIQTPTPGIQNQTLPEPESEPEPKPEPEPENIATSTLKILINEIQIENSSNVKEEFVELYNPNEEDIDLTDWYLQRKTKTANDFSSFAPKSLFTEKTIGSKNYFLIANASSSFSADIFTTYSLTKDNTLIIKNPYQEIIDKVGWGEAQDFEINPVGNPLANKTIGRKWSTTTGEHIDTDNNLTDFEIQEPTPKSQNQKDTTAPQTTIISSPGSLTNQNTALFSFSSNENGSTFQCQIDNESWETCLSPLIYEGIIDGSHNFSIKALDQAGNEEVNPVEYSWTIDTTIESPLLSLTDYDTNSSLYTNKQIIKVIISNDEEATGWFLSENSERPTIDTLGWTTSTQPANFNLSPGDSSANSGKTKTVYLWTKDLSENVSELGNSASIVLDIAPPEISIDEKPLDQTNQTTSIFSFYSNENCFFEYKIDQENWQKSDKIGQSSDFTAFADEGEHLFQVRALDQAENFSPISEYSWLIDLTPPLSQIEPLATSSTSTSFTLKMTGSDPVIFPASGILNYDIQYAIDNATNTISAEKDWQNLVMATTSTNVNFIGQDEKTYYFRSRARDKAENEEDWPETADTFSKIEIPKDAQPPSAVSDLKAETGENPGEIKLTWTAPEDNWDPYKPSNYIIKYFSEKIEETNWASSTMIAEPPSPQDAGTTQSFIVSGLVNNTLYYFALKSKDDANNISVISNSTSSETLAAILDISTTTLNFSAFQNGKNPPGQFLTVENKGKVKMNWNTAATSSWITTVPENGTLGNDSSIALEVSVNISGLAIGEYQTIIAFETENAKNSPQDIEINLVIEEPPNQPPIAMFSCLQENHYLGQEIIFDASESSDPDDDPISFLWDFGDGVPIVAPSEITSHTFVSSGEFSIYLVVQDSEGATSSTSTLIQILEKPKVLVSEVQIKDREFVELYNFGDKPVSITGWYLSYFSANKKWNEPQRNWLFPVNAIIPQGSNYLIGIYDYPEENGNPNSDWQVLTQASSTYQTGQFSNEKGSAGIFFCDPSVKTAENAEKCKIDIFAWQEENATGTLIYEKNPFSFRENDIEGKSFQRKKEGENYIDTDNNLTDFEILAPSPTNSKEEIKVALPPNPIENFQITDSADNNITLDWSTTTDNNTPPGNISYIVYWSREEEITSTTLNYPETIKATTTETNLTIENLYYNSTYYFGIRAFDQSLYSEISAIAHPIAPETPQWQMFGGNNQRVFQSSFTGPTDNNPLLEVSYEVGNWEIKHLTTGPTIDQNGTIYIGASGLLALEQKNEKLQEKWFYPHDFQILQPPLIAKDGTIYAITYDNKILAISPDGKLRWGKEINTSFSNSSIAGRYTNLAISDNYLYYPTPSTTETFLIAMDKDTGETIWNYSLGQKNENRAASSPTISLDGTIYISFENTLFAFNEQGNLQWKKTFQINENCGQFIPYLIPQISVSNQTIYFIVKGTDYVYYETCKDTLYAVKESSTTNATTTLTNEEIKWQNNYMDFPNEKSLMFFDEASEKIYFSQYYSINSRKYRKLYFIDEKELGDQKTITPISIDSWNNLGFLPQLLDNQQNIYGVEGSDNSIISGLISKENRIWSTQRGNPLFSISFPPALSKEEILYFVAGDKVLTIKNQE